MGFTVVGFNARKLERGSRHFFIGWGLLHNLRRFNDLLDTMILVLRTEVVHRRSTVSPDPPDGPDCREEVKRTEKLCKGIAPLTTDLLCLLGEWDRRAGGSGSEVTGQDGR